MQDSWSRFGPSMSRRRGAATFSPSSLTNLRGWYKSDVGITIATGVSQWDDQSGNGNHLVQATGGAQPVVTAAAINGRDAITFDGVDDVLTVTFALAQPLTFFAMIRQDTWTNGDILLNAKTVSAAVAIQQLTTTPGIGLNAGAVLGPTSSLVLSTFGLVTGIFNGASSVIQVNNIAETAGAAGANVPTGISAGARGDGTAFAACAIAEIICMAAVATAGERANMRAYSQARYGVGA